MSITVTDVAGVLTELASTAPEHADPPAEHAPARYLVAGKPNCLVAKVMARLGFSTTVLRALDREHAIGNVIHPGVRLSESRHPALRALDARTLALLQHIQDCQDAGQRWGAIARKAFSPAPWFLPERSKPWLC